MRPEEQIELVDRIAAQLGEQFECVQILVSTCLENGKGTESVYSGFGNWFARQGMARDFVTKDDASTHAKHLADRLDPPPQDESEAWRE